MRVGRTQPLLRRASVGAIVVAFVLCATAFIRNPGLYYDETLFVNVAVGAPAEIFVKRVGGVPLLLMPYIGALKAWVYFPIFRLAGVSPATIRIPAVLISAATLLLGYSIGRRFLRPPLALLFLLLMATDPAFITQSRLDWGPIVISCFLKLLALRFLCDVLTRGSILAFGGFVAASVLGVFDKLTFIWFVNGALVAGGLVYGPRVLAYARRAPARAALAAAVLAGVCIASFVRISFVAPHPLNLDASTSLDRFRWTATLAANTLSGGSAWFNTRVEPATQVTVVLQCFWLALGSIAVWWGLRRGTAARAASAPLLSAVAFSLLMIVALEVQLVVTANTIGTHHTLIFWPFHHFLIAGAAALLLGDEEAGVNVRRVLAWTVTAVLTILVGSQLWVTSLYIRSYASGHGFHMSWDPAIYQLSDALNRRLDARSTVIFTDWGIATQLLALAQPEYRTALRDWWPTFNDLATAPESSRTWLRGQLVRPGVLIVTHSAGASVMKQARRNLQQFVQDEHLHLERLEAIDSVDGRPLYEILRAY